MWYIMLACLVVLAYGVGKETGFENGKKQILNHMEHYWEVYNDKLQRNL